MNKLYVSEICSVEGCDEPKVAHNLCMMHYRRMKRNGTLELTKRPRKRLYKEGVKCTIPGCTNSIRGKGLCKYHYNLRYYQDHREESIKKAMKWQQNHRERANQIAREYRDRLKVRGEI